MDDTERTPGLDDAGRAMLRPLREHPDAPRWNYAVGDRLTTPDLAAIAAFRGWLETPWATAEAGPPPAVLRSIAALRTRVEWFREKIPPGLDLEQDWGSIPTACRRDLRVAPWMLVPDDAALDRLIIYRTAGTTGHPIEVPHHPAAIGCYLPLLERALAAHGVAPPAEPGPTPGVGVGVGTGAGEAQAACFLISAQVKTYTYCTVLSAWGGAGFAKLNLRASEWPCRGSARRYFEAFAPRLLTGEPVAFAELLRLGIPARPTACVSTSLALAPALARRLQAELGCPVIDWYSMVETGPIAYACPLGHGMHLLAPDLHVEALDAGGVAVADGARGELAISGGRNPYLPLLRYRTGDWGRIERTDCPCGDRAPRILDLEGRSPVLFRASDDTPVGAVDLSRALREFPLLQHRFEQRADRTCHLVVRPLPGHAIESPVLEQALRRLLGDLPIEFEFELDAALGEDPDRKIIPYRSALALGAD